MAQIWHASSVACRGTHTLSGDKLLKRNQSIFWCNQFLTCVKIPSGAIMSPVKLIENFAQAVYFHKHQAAYFHKHQAVYFHKHSLTSKGDFAICKLSCEKRYYDTPSSYHGNNSDDESLPKYLNFEEHLFCCEHLSHQCFFISKMSMWYNIIVILFSDFNMRHVIDCHLKSFQAIFLKLKCDLHIYIIYHCASMRVTQPIKRQIKKLWHLLGGKCFFKVSFLRKSLPPPSPSCVPSFDPPPPSSLWSDNTQFCSDDQGIAVWGN